MAKPSPSIEVQNKRLVTDFVEKVLLTGEVDLVPKYVSRNHIDHNNKSPTDNPIGDLQRHIIGFRRAYPDLSLTIDFQIAEGDLVMSRLTYRGTQSLSYLGFGPTGKLMQLVGAKIMRISNGLIAESWGYFNTLEAFDEYGALTPTEIND